MISLLRRKLEKRLELEPDDLAQCQNGSRILMALVAGYANQVRSAIAIATSGLVPVLQTNSAFRKAVSMEEGIDLSQLFNGIATEEPSDRRSRRFRHLIIPPWPGLEPAQAAEIFNMLNLIGGINPSRLAHMPDTRRHIRDVFDSFRPRLDRSRTAERTDRSVVAIHLRMFDRNRVTRYLPPGRNVHPGRHYAKEAWTTARMADAVAAVSTIAPSGAPIAVYTDRRDHCAVGRFFELTQAAGFQPHFVELEHLGALGAMEENMLLSGHRRLILTGTSTFGHLAALLSEDLEMVLSV